jgi:predicted secreted protein
MPSIAIPAFGTLVKIGDGGGPENFTTIAELMDIKGPKFKADTEDVTNHLSTGSWEEVVTTILRSGEVTFDVNFVPQNATHSYSSGVLRDFNNKTRRNFKLVFPDVGNTTWAFAAFITGFESEAPVKGKLKAAITLKITGQPTLA